MIIRIGNQIAEKEINLNPYLFDVDGNTKDIGRRIWKVYDKNIPNDFCYIKTKKGAIDFMKKVDKRK